MFQLVLGKVNEENANQLLPLLASKNSDEASLLQLIDKANTVDLARDIAAHNSSSQRIQDKLKELWPDHFTSQITPNLTDKLIDAPRKETNEPVKKLFAPPDITSGLQNTDNPVARSLVGRNHFFTEPDRKTELSQAMEAFESELGRLDGFNNHGVGGPK